MTFEQLPSSADSPADITFGSPEACTVAGYERELTAHRRTEIWLREALARDEALIRQKDELIQNEQLLSRESEHRLLNGLQMIVALLSLQSRASENTEAASQLTAAANRVAMIERVHRHLHCLDGAQTVAFKKFIEELGRDFSMMVPSDEATERCVSLRDQRSTWYGIQFFNTPLNDRHARGGIAREDANGAERHN